MEFSQHLFPDRLTLPAFLDCTLTSFLIKRMKRVSSDVLEHHGNLHS